LAPVAEDGPAISVLALAKKFLKEPALPSPHFSLLIAPVRTDAHVRCACDIMVEAAEWLADIGQPLWNRDSLTPEKIRPLPDKGTLYLAHLGDQPVGAFVLLFEDPFFWPEAPPHEAFYLHKLVVCRSVAGTGMSRSLLEHAVGEASVAGRRFLRLDCAPRPKLCAFYESAGFRHHSDRTVGSFTACRYERTTGSARHEPELP
jgi:GNAT superfamily N-acetyltransferase